eukprot:1489051-Rhodomonas_salina.7
MLAARGVVAYSDSDALYGHRPAETTGLLQGWEVGVEFSEPVCGFRVEQRRPSALQNPGGILPLQAARSIGRFSGHGRFVRLGMDLSIGLGVAIEVHKCVVHQQRVQRPLPRRLATFPTPTVDLVPHQGERRIAFGVVDRTFCMFEELEDA